MTWSTSPTAAGSDDLAPGTILMSESAAKSDKVKPGDTVRVQFARSGVETLTLAGTYETNQLIGDYLVDASKAKDFSTQRDVAGLVGLTTALTRPLSGRRWTRR